MNTSQFSLNYGEYEALLAGRFETALTVVGQTMTVRLSGPGSAARTEGSAPRATAAIPQQRHDALIQNLTMRGWANALLSDAHQLLVARAEGGEQPGRSQAETGWPTH